MPHAFGRTHFQGQQADEEVVHIIHRHWFDILSHFLVVLVLSFLLIASLLAFPLLFPEILDAANTRLFLFVENTLFIFIWLFGFLTWIDYYFDVWIITDKRIVNIEQRGLFVRHISELHFSRIQDVTAAVTGIIPTMLNYGDVEVQTAGEEGRFIFRRVPDPYRIKDVIMKFSQGAISDDLRKMADALRAGKAAL
ncbi:MAG: hypothetical protein A3E38_01615 [Candidatus Moranbacteria bacterium RIFCSPHIGHO2_12_FULL_54_9]|nr:MAG: hypothetical protein A2878_03435 [Candidatus Moranbacteria bacterium RIFCSPHIGHO2_01_FULL_54_31]OGI25991.1 MAG: hypothetical protein A3E38_01615 [Candidatus Moranbacteria bacterium RIFCSPHIGHO2_12_FULL_54_9]